MLGPGYMPPQGARALVREVLTRRLRGGPSVSATVLDEPDGSVLEFVNEGGETAADLRFVTSGGRGSVGHLPPGETGRVRVVADEPFRCVWICGDARGRRHVWSYDGRHERLARGRRIDDATCFALFYD